MSKEDTINTKRIFLSPPHMSGMEIEYVKEAFESNFIAPLGPQVDAFERDFCEAVGISHAVALASGTAAMHLALRVLGVGPGDEVVASTLTFIGSVSPIIFQGATPVFIDVDRSTWNMSPDLLREELRDCAKRGKLPKAVVPTDLYGQCADLDTIMEICDPYRIPVVIDAAESLGAKYNGRSSGKGAMLAVFSFNGNKIITTSGGGMLASDNKDLIDKARYLSQQAREPFSHYEHVEIGYNYRMSNILAAIGRGQLKVLDKRVKRKREIFNYYQNILGGLPGIDFMPEASYGRCNRWLTVILITPGKFGVDREVVRMALEAENMEARPVWKPMHLQPMFNYKSEVRSKAKGSDQSTKNKIQRYPTRVIGGKVAEDLFREGLCLPSGTAMRENDLKRVVDTIIKTQFQQDGVGRICEDNCGKFISDCKQRSCLNR